MNYNSGKYIACDICGCRFDSGDFQFCKPCEFYEEGFKKFGRIKSNEEYMLEMLRDEAVRMMNE